MQTTRRQTTTGPAPRVAPHDVLSQHPQSSSIPPTSTPIILRDGHISGVSREQLAALRARAEYLGINGRSHMAFRPTAPGQSSLNANIATSSSASTSAMTAPQAGPSRLMNSQTVPHTSHQASHSPHAPAYLHNTAPAMPQTPHDVLASLPSALNTMYAGLIGRMVRTEEAVREALQMSQRFDRLEQEFNERREQSREDSRNMLAFLENLARMNATRLTMVEASVERVANALGASSCDEPVAEPSSGSSSDSKKSLVDRMNTVECLLMELLEKANDPDAAKSPVIRHEIGVSTDPIIQVEIGTQSTSYHSERRGSSVSTSANHTDSATNMPLEVQSGADAPVQEKPVQVRVDASIAKIYGDEDARPFLLPHSSGEDNFQRTGAAQEHPFKMMIDGSYTSCSSPTSMSKQYPSGTSPRSALSPLHIAEFQNTPFAPEPLRSAMWQEDEVSDLSSRSTSPGCTVADLRAIINHSQQRPSRSGNTSPKDDAPFSCVAPHQLEGTGTSAAPRTSPLPSSPNAPLARIHFSPPITALSRTPSPLSLPQRGRSPSASLADEEARSAHGKSSDSLFDGEGEDVEVATPTAPIQPGHIFPVVFSYSDDGESEIPASPEAQPVRGRADSISTLSPLSLKRARSLSLESLSSLSSVPSSRASSVAVETALVFSSNASAPMTLPAQSSPRPAKKRVRKRRKTDPVPGSSATAFSKEGDKGSKSDTSKLTSRRKQKKLPRYWEVVQGYNGPCDWPEALPDGKSCRNLIMCDLCECWYHWGCVGIGDDDPRASQEEIDFTCPPCAESIQRHGIARKVRNHLDDCCARPQCDNNLGINEFFLERVIARIPHNLGVNPPEFVWLFKWVGYGITDATWEIEFPTGRDQYIKEFEQAARQQGFATRDLTARIFLREAREGGWR